MQRQICRQQPEAQLVSTGPRLNFFGTSSWSFQSLFASSTFHPCLLLPPIAGSPALQALPLPALGLEEAQEVMSPFRSCSIPFSAVHHRERLCTEIDAEEGMPALLAVCQDTHCSHHTVLQVPLCAHLRWSVWVASNHFLTALRKGSNAGPQDRYFRILMLWNQFDIYNTCLCRLCHRTVWCG